MPSLKFIHQHQGERRACPCRFLLLLKTCYLLPIHISQTTQDNDNYEQTPAAVFLHTAHVKQISLLCYRDYIVYDNETFVFNLKSMVKWRMSHFRVVGWACYVEPCKISNKHSHVYHQNHDIFYYNQSLNDAVLYQISLQSDLGLAAFLQRC